MQLCGSHDMCVQIADLKPHLISKALDVDYCELQLKLGNNWRLRKLGRIEATPTGALVCGEGAKGRRGGGERRRDRISTNAAIAATRIR